MRLMGEISAICPKKKPIFFAVPTYLGVQGGAEKVCFFSDPTLLRVLGGDKGGEIV